MGFFSSIFGSGKNNENPGYSKPRGFIPYESWNIRSDDDVKNFATQINDYLEHCTDPAERNYLREQLNMAYGALEDMNTVTSDTLVVSGGKIFSGDTSKGYKREPWMSENTTGTVVVDGEHRYFFEGQYIGTPEEADDLGYPVVGLNPYRKK